MADRCDLVLAELDQGHSCESDELRAHLAECRACRDQRAAHVGLRRAFRATAQPALSPHFVPDVCRRLAARGADQARSRWFARLLGCYWMVVCGAGCWIAADLARVLPTVSPVAMGLLAAGLGLLLLPVLMLAGLFRVGVLGLVVRTLDLAWTRAAPRLRSERP